MRIEVAQTEITNSIVRIRQRGGRYTTWSVAIVSSALPRCRFVHLSPCRPLIIDVICSANTLAPASFTGIPRWSVSIRLPPGDTILISSEAGTRAKVPPACAGPSVTSLSLLCSSHARQSRERQSR